MGWNVIQKHQHLCDVVHFALANRATNVMGSFEETSRMLRERRLLCGGNPKTRAACTGKSDTFQLALKVCQSIKHQDRMPSPDMPEEDPCVDCGDVLAALQAASRGGVALPSDEALAVAMAVKALATNRALTRLRFWGKVLGRRRDYLVAEAELTDDELDRRVDVRGAADQAELEDELNRKVYLVAVDDAWAPWAELPPVRPRHVQAARALDSRGLLFSGDLDAQVADFPGSEAHWLHAQLVRISASCSVSPLGAYVQTPAVSLDLAEDECGVALNADWRGVPGSASLAELADPGLAGWAHHAPCVLPSGRLARPQQAEGHDASSDEVAEEEDEEAEEEEDDMGDAQDEDEDEEGDEEDSLEGARRLSGRHSEDEGDVEVGDEAPLLCSLSQDAPVLAAPQARCPAWTARLSSTRLPQTASVMLRSNRWPGAVAYCSGRTFGQLYVGWGMKAGLPPHSGCPQQQQQSH